MIYRFVFADGQCVDLDVVEFGNGGEAGQILDYLSIKHGGLKEVLNIF